MESDVSKIKRLLREVVNANANIPIIATVLAITGNTCSVKLKSGLVLSDVKLQATGNDSSNYFRVTPKINTSVLLLSLSGELENLTVIKVDAIEKVEYIQGDLQLVINSTDNKIGVKNGSTSLKELMDDLANIIKQLKVFTPAGPSGTPLPPTIVQVQEFETKMQSLLK